MKPSARFISLVALVTTMALGASTVSCAYILHPERRNGGSRGNRLDTLPLVVDILLFLPGVVPGVIALVVDFTTGAIYTTGSAKGPITVPGKVAVRLPAANKSVEATLTLVTADGRVLDRASTAVSAGGAAGELVVDVGDGARRAEAIGASPEGLRLELSGFTDTPARIAVVAR